MKNFENKVAVITGAGSGIGRGIAETAADNQMHLVLADVDEIGLNETLEIVKSKGVEAIARVTDVSKLNEVENLASQTYETFQNCHLLFNNAGTNAPGVSLEELTYDQWINVVSINLTGVFLCTQEAFNIMKSQSPMGGRIINNGSVSAHVPRPGSAPYTATKHAVTGLTRSTSLDGRKYNIACGQIDIGNALTEMAARMTKGVPQANGSTEIEPVMDVSNVAQTIVHMSSLPADANVQFVTVMATKMPFIGRG